MAAKAVEVVADMLVSTTELATILGLTARRVQQLSQDGIIVPVSRGKYPLGDSVQRYVNYVRKQLEVEDAKVESGKRKSEAVLKAAKAKIAQMEAEELGGNMHRSEDVEAMLEDLIYNIRSNLMALPGRLAADVLEAESESEAFDIIRKEVYSALNNLSRYKYDRKKFEERVRERKNWEADRTGDDDE